MAKSSSQLAAAARLSERFPILLVFSWAILYLRRPFILGLYSDDWWFVIEPQHGTAPFSLDRLHYFVGLSSIYAPRPLMGLTAFLVTSIAGASPVAIQFLSTLMVLAGALSLRSWLNRIMTIFPNYRNVTGDFAVVFWLAIPWSLGETAWPTLIHNLGAQILFTEVARLLLVRQRLTLGLAALVTAGIVGSSLFYEAFYFAIIPVVVFYWMMGRGPAKSGRDLATLLGTCFLAQAIPIAFNRYSASRAMPGSAKKFNPHWLQWTIGNLLALPKALLNSFPEYRLLGFFLAVLVLVCALSRWLAGRHADNQRLFRRYLTGLIALALATLVLSDAIYSAAGYGLASIGLASRTLFAASLSLTVGFFALLCPAFLPGARFTKAGLLAASAGLVLVLATAEQYRVQEWASAWREELRILQTAPLEEFQRLPAPAAILFTGPSDYRGVPIFDSQWDLTAAVASKTPLKENRRPYQGLRTIYTAGEFTWTWDGATLSKSREGRLEAAFPAPQLYLWREGASSHLEIAQPGFRWPHESPDFD